MSLAEAPAGDPQVRRGDPQVACLTEGLAWTRLLPAGQPDLSSIELPGQGGHSPPVGGTRGGGWFVTVTQDKRPARPSFEPMIQLLETCYREMRSRGIHRCVERPGGRVCHLQESPLGRQVWAGGRRGLRKGGVGDAECQVRLDRAPWGPRKRVCASQCVAGDLPGPSLHNDCALRCVPAGKRTRQRHPQAESGRSEGGCTPQGTQELLSGPRDAPCPASTQRTAGGLTRWGSCLRCSDGLMTCALSHRHSCSVGRPAWPRTDGGTPGRQETAPGVPPGRLGQGGLHATRGARL